MTKWLLAHQSPKAASTVVQSGNQVSFVVEGNVSGWSMAGVLTQEGFKVAIEPIGSSQPVGNIYVMV